MENPARIDCSIVVPVYRGMDNLDPLVAQIEAQMQASGFDGRFEVVLVDDCSPDESWKTICRIAREKNFVKGVTLRRNFGQHNATMAGLHFASGIFVIIMDDDLQHPPSAIAGMIDKLTSGYDVCYTRYLNRQHAAWQKVGSRFNDWVATWLLGKPPRLYLSSFKAIRRDVVERILDYDGPHTYIDGLIVNITHSITSIDINHQARHSGKSNYNLIRSISLWLRMATSFSVRPLRLASLAGFMLAAVSALIFLYVIVERLRDPTLPAGWASVIATILLIGGMQTLCLGIIGEYVGRIYLKANRMPQFVVGDTTFSDDRIPRSPLDELSTKSEAVTPP